MPRPPAPRRAPSPPRTLTYRPAPTTVQPAVLAFEDKQGRLARRDGPFNYLIVRNRNATATLEIYVDQSRAHVIVVGPGDAFADNVQSYSSLAIETDVNIAANELLIMPKRVATPGGVDVGA